MECIICNSSNLKRKHTFSQDRYIYYCPDCTTQCLLPQLNDQELTQLYSKNYFSAWGIEGADNNEITRDMKALTFKRLLGILKKFINQGKLLDVGCASGYFLDQAVKVNFIPYGVDISAYASAIAEKKYGDRIFNGILENAPFLPATFNVITMSDFIEHVRNPLNTLTKATALLKEGGYIMIVTPDTGSFLNRIMKSRWTHYKLEHFFYFNVKSIALLAKKCGLEVVLLKKNKKALNLYYLHAQLNTYPHWLLTPLINLLNKIVPGHLKNLPLYISIGEMLVLLRKPLPTTGPG